MQADIPAELQQLRRELKEAQAKLETEQDAARAAALKALDGMDRAEEEVEAVRVAAQSQIQALQEELSETKRAADAQRQIAFQAMVQSEVDTSAEVDQLRQVLAPLIDRAKMHLAGSRSRPIVRPTV